MNKYLVLFTLLFSTSVNAQWNFWHSSLHNNRCLKTASSCLAHYNNNCRIDGQYIVNGASVTCSMSTGGGQLVSSLNLAKIISGKQYVFIPQGTSSSSLSSGYHPANLNVSAVFSIQSPKTNLLIGQSQLKTTQATNCHVGTLNTCYNYVGGPNWFSLRSINVADFSVIVFENGFVGLITAADNGNPAESVKDAYIYYRNPAGYLIYELP